VEIRERCPYGCRFFTCRRFFDYRNMYFVELFSDVKKYMCFRNFLLTEYKNSGSIILIKGSSGAIMRLRYRQRDDFCHSVRNETARLLLHVLCNRGLFFCVRHDRFGYHN